MSRSAVHAAVAVVAVLTALTGGLRAVAQNPQQRPVFRAGANFVSVDVYPRRDGHVLEGLKAADFTILEDGKPQNVESFEFIRVESNTPDAVRRDPATQEEGNELAADPRNRVFVVYLDVYHVNLDGSRRMRGPVVGFLNHLLAPNDLFGVTTPLSRPSDLVLARKTTTLEDELDRHWAWGGQAMSMQGTPLEPAEAALADCYGWGHDTSANSALKEIVDRRREEVVINNLEGLVTHLGSLREERKTLIVFTRGWVLFGNEPGKAQTIIAGSREAKQLDRSSCNAELTRVFSMDNRERFRNLISTANRQNVTFYTVNPAGLEPPDVMGVNSGGAEALDLLRGRADSMRVLSNNTDGLTIIENNDLATGLKRITDDLSAYYLLGYYSTNTKFDGKFRQIDVRVATPGVKVSARRGYIAPKPADAAASAVTPTRAAGPSPIDDALAVLSRLRPSSELFTYGVVTGNEMQVVVEIAGAQVEMGKWSAGADIQATVTGAGGEAIGTVKGRIEPGARGGLLRVPVTATSAGPWHVSVVASGGGDSLDDRADVKRVSGALLGPALVFRATPAARSPLRAVADFQFRRTERLHLEWPVMKPLDRREARVLDRKGQPLAVAATVTERDEGAGRTTLAVDVNLAPMAEGDYVVEVSAGSGADAERGVVAFRVIR